MKTATILALGLLLPAAAHAHCHASPEPDDIALYDAAVVSALESTAWNGQAAAMIAHEAVGWRRTVVPDQAGSRAEQRLYDAVVVSALRHAGSAQYQILPQLSVSDIALRAAQDAQDAMGQRMLAMCAG